MCLAEIFEEEGPGIGEMLREQCSRQRAQPVRRPWGGTVPGMLEEQQGGRSAGAERVRGGEGGGEGCGEDFGCDQREAGRGGAQSSFH